MSNNLIVDCISVHRFIQLANKESGTVELLEVGVWLVVLLWNRGRDVVVILIVVPVMMATVSTAVVAPSVIIV